MLKICIVSPGLSDGGTERVSSILANYFIKQKYEVMFISVYNEKKEYVLDDNIKYMFLNIGKKNNKVISFYKRSSLLRKSINKFNPDIIISFVINEMLFIKRKNRIVFSLRNDPTKNVKNNFEKIIRNYLYKKGAFIVFQTTNAQDYFPKKIKKKSKIINNPIVTNDLPLWDYKSREKKFITACRLNKQKNIPMLVKAFCKFHLGNQDYKLEIYGEGQEKQKIKELINKLDANNYIFLNNHSSNIHNIMSKSSCFVLSSDYEGVSNSMLEALCIGIPCICTDCPPGGARKFINDNNGLLVPVGDIDSLSNAMTSIINNINKYNNETYSLIRDEVDVEKVCKQWEEICIHIINK